MIYYRWDNDFSSGGEHEFVHTPVNTQPTSASWFRDFRDETNASRVPVTVIIPVFNEEQTISEVVSQVYELPFEKEIIVVDDGSDDATPAMLESWHDLDNIVVITHEENQGKGSAIRSGIEVAGGSIVVIQDADLEYDPNDLQKVLMPLVLGEADIVYGSRYRDGQTRHPHATSHYGVKLLNRMVRWLYGVRLTDEATCYKAIRKSILRRMQLECRGFEFCPEVTAKACRMGLDIVEVPIGYHARGYDAGKKIRLRDGLTAITTLWRYRNWAEPNLAPPVSQPLIERAAS